ncbi:hypothetical protein IAD21_01084 [Abditibacteriota bacterium]|nr:hypothetical protein IAD21_01084 [Abditibacteriota bacterium]
MKISTFLLGAGLIGTSIVLAGGCSSSASETSLSTQQREIQTIGAKNIPAPAQSLAVQQSQQKSQMDAMRANDAKNNH